ncbi:hypothetical protein ACS0TY_028306 [Phlomoides rotata]
MYFEITALFCFSVLRISSSVLRNYSPNLFHSVFLTIGSKFLGVSECSQQESILAMARIHRRKTEVLLVVEKIILEIIFMFSVVINRYRNTGQFRGFNVEYMRRYRMADRFP